MDFQIVTDAAVEPVAVADFKAEYAKIDFPDEDALIEKLLKTSRRLLERKYNVGIVEKDVSVLVNNSCGMIDLPGSPVGAIVLPADATIVGNNNKFLSYPVSCSVSLSYKSGYPLSDVPEEYLTAIKQQAIYMFENRGDATTDPASISPAAQETMQPYSRNTNGMWL